MAHAITTQVILNGRVETIIKVTIKGDGVSGELSKQIIYDASAYLTASTNNKIMEIEYCLNGFSGELFWDATTDVAIMSLAKSYPYKAKFICDGGLVNNAGTGRTGDILLSTVGLASQTYDGYILLYINQRDTDIVGKI